MKAALPDIQIFIEFASKKDVNKVITRKTLKPIVEALFDNPSLDQAEPDLIRAEIAGLFIQGGFNYLTSMKIQETPSLHTWVILEAIELSRLLVESFKPKSERQSFARVP